MLPFLQKKNPGGVTTQVRPSDNPDKTDGDAPIEACARDLIDAIQTNDTKGVVAALKAAFEILDSQPHEEGPHTNEESE